MGNKLDDGQELAWVGGQPTEGYQVQNLHSVETMSSEVGRLMKDSRDETAEGADNRRRRESGVTSIPEWIALRMMPVTLLKFLD